MGSSWVNVKSERQAWRLELQAEADPAVLRQNFFFFQEASGFALRAFDWLDEATAVLSVISSTEVLMMDVSHIHKIPSRWHLDECLVESLDTGLPKLTQTADHHSTCQMFFSWKNPHICTMITAFCSSLVFSLRYVICGEQNKWRLLVLCTW